MKIGSKYIYDSLKTLLVEQGLGRKGLAQLGTTIEI